MRSRQVRGGVLIAAAAAGALLAEPGMRSRPAIASNVWQEVWSPDGFWCEDCCKVGFCCTLDSPCRYLIDSN